MSGGNDQAGAISISSAASELDDEQVRDYLKEHHDFLQRNPDMLDYLHISHASGSAISLVEKQVSVLRERNMDMRHRLNALTGNARDNDKLYEKTRDLVLQLLEAESVAALYRVFIDSMTDQFEVDHACMILYGDSDTWQDCRTETLAHTETEIGPLINGHKAVCGTLRPEELQFLFPEGAAGIGSAALMPLHNGDPVGLIAVGSSDAHRYSKNTGTIFLSHLADVIVRLLPRIAQNG